MRKAFLLVSFGGPESPDEVIPFLERVTAGRGVPRERLDEVAQHYLVRGGRSPINDLNRNLLAALIAELADRGDQTPVLWGNRNSAPELDDVLEEALKAGVGTVRVLTTSAYPSYSGCRQYRENVTDALAALRERGVKGAAELRLEFCEHVWDTDGFVNAQADAVEAALASAEVSSADRGVVLFTTHSIPVSMNEASGPTGGEYTQAHQSVAARVMRALHERGSLTREIPFELVFCSRSGPPQVPWLEPDINDRIRELADDGVGAVVVAPIGFISDHMEVVHDLDTEARETATECGIGFVRAATVDTHPAFIVTLVDALLATPRVCPQGCCPAPQRRPLRQQSQAS